MIDAVFFDGDQTLWDFQALMRRALERTLQVLRRQRPCEATNQLDVESMVSDRVAVAAHLDGAGATLEELRHAAFVRTLERIGLPDLGLADLLNEHYLRWRFTDVPLYPDVLPCLTLLARRFRLGLLSNGNGYPEQSGLTGVFSAVVFSQDHGVEKPDRRIFDIAVGEIGSRADRLVMAGDSLQNDVWGAHEAGWDGIWLNRERHPAPNRAPPHTITNLGQLTGVLAHLT